MLAVTNKKDAAQAKVLISKAKEYVTGLRIELERKELLKNASQSDEEKIRIAELACYFTVCDMNVSHKFLALKSAVTLLYKMNNFITAGHCA